MNEYKNEEFFQIIKPIASHLEFQKLKGFKHHGIDRYDHCMRVAYFTFFVTKFFHLHYREATEAAFLHDFFMDEVSMENGFLRLSKHPSFALKNAKKYFLLSPLQENIIETHMFPFSLKIPKYLESWIVDFIDDVAAIYERGFAMKRKFVSSISVFFLLVIRFFQ